MTTYTQPQLDQIADRVKLPFTFDVQKMLFLNGAHVEMVIGECRYLRLTDPHSIVNSGNTQSINMSIDMIPNESVVNEILKAER